MIQRPKLSRAGTLTLVAARDVIAESSFTRSHLKGIDLGKINAGNVSFDESFLEKALFGEARLERLSLTDSELIRCDFAAVHCAGSSLIRVGVSGTRLAGADLSRSLFKDVVFEDCKLDMANFRFAKLTRVRFVDCTLHETDFQMAELVDVEFQACQLRKTTFDRCKLKSVDARTSQLHDIRGWQSLRGLTIDPIQLAAIAPELAAELGLKVIE